jgi:phage antirepressor YoqD-like protein/predicted transcriptional regulator
MNLPSLHQNQTMSSREIAELVESRHDSVKRSMETLQDKGLISFTQSVETSHAGAGARPVDVYVVGKRDSYVIVAQLSPEFTARLVDRWQELESMQAPALPNYQEALRQLADSLDKQAQLEHKIEADAPKVEFAMAVRRMEGSCKIGDFSKVIGIGRTTMFAKLRADEILMADNMPYQRYVDAEYFVVIEQTPYTDRDGKAHPTFTTMLTGKGQVWLERKYRKASYRPHNRRQV